MPSGNSKLKTHNSKLPSLDTIVALSSATSAVPLGAADVPRGILRLSGQAALTIASRLIQVQPRQLPECDTWHRVAGEINFRTHTLRASAYIMRAPRSYTREDVVELHVPGLPWLLSDLLEQAVAAGARQAEPGEFTRRAFEHGRLSLEQAAAVGELVRARSADEARVFAARLQGKDTQQRQNLRQQLEELLALIELGLDFSEEDVVVLSKEEMLQRLENLRTQLQQAAGENSATAEPALLDAALPRVVLAGPTNAGKSTLFNTLLQRDAVIVSATRHTTRDCVSALLTLQHQGTSVTCRLLDSAGYGAEFASEQFGTLTTDNSAQWLQQAAWQATVRAIRSADILLVALDGSLGLDRQEDLNALRTALSQTRPARLAILWTKADVAARAAPTPDQLNALLPLEGIAAAKIFSVSAVSGAGIPALQIYLAEELHTLGSRTQDSWAAAMIAARSAAGRAADALQSAADALRNKLGEDVIVVEVREALHAFWQAEGVRIRHDAITENMLDRIFASFCIGK